MKAEFLLSPDEEPDPELAWAIARLREIAWDRFETYGPDDLLESTTDYDIIAE